MSTPRRRFLRTLGCGGAAAAGILALPGAISDRLIRKAHGTEVTRTYPRQRVGALSELSDRVAVTFSYPDELHACTLLKLGAPAADGVGEAGDVVAFSNICPHLGCAIDYRHDAAAPDAIPAAMMGPCPCHFSSFDLSKRGVQIQGQATESLPQVVLETDGDDIFAVAMRGLIYGRYENVSGGA